MNEKKTNGILSNFFWRLAERFGAKGVEFIVQIVLARLLTPTDYGVVGLVTVFISIANVFVQSSFGQALVQKLNTDNKDFSSVFYLNVMMGILLYIAMFFASPFIAEFYNNEALTEIIRVLSLTLVVGSINAIQQAYVQKTMQFKRFFYSTMIGTLVSAVVGIVMAYNGMGVWALVVQTLTNRCIDTLVLWVTVKWRPEKYFSSKRAKKLFSFGWKLLCSGLLDTIYNNMYSLIIGKVFSEQELGFYNRGKQFPMLIVENINGSIQSVIFPALAAKQNNIEDVKNMVRKAIKMSTFLIFPAMAGLAAVAKPLVTILLTDKWLTCVPFLQFSCFVYAFWPIHTANLQAINAVGRSDIFLKLEIIKKIVGITILCITLPFGLHIMMFGQCCGAVIGSFINASPNKKLLNYSYFEQMKDVLPSMLLSMAMCGIILCINLLELNVWLTIIFQIVLGIVIYFLGAKLFKFEMLDYIIDKIRKIRERK